MFRRNFINLAAFAFSAPAFAQIYGDKSDDYDLIVVGSGAAGLCAAISAFDHGVRKIVVLEKLPILGGTSAISGPPTRLFFVGRFLCLLLLTEYLQFRNGI